MTVTFRSEEDGDQTPQPRIVTLESKDDERGEMVWKLADVKGNSPGLGRTMNKAMRAQRWSTNANDILRMQLYIEL